MNFNKTENEDRLDELIEQRESNYMDEDLIINRLKLIDKEIQVCHAIRDYFEEKSRILSKSQ